MQIVMGWKHEHLNRFRIYEKDEGVYHDGDMVFDYNSQQIGSSGLKKPAQIAVK